MSNDLVQNCAEGNKKKKERMKNNTLNKLQTA